MIMKLLEHAHVENHAIKVLTELKFKMVLLTFHILRHEDFFLEGFGMKNYLDDTGAENVNQRVCQCDWRLLAFSQYIRNLSSLYIMLQ